MRIPAGRLKCQQALVQTLDDRGTDLWIATSSSQGTVLSVCGPFVERGDPDAGTLQ